MKREIAFAVALLAVALTFTGCGSMNSSAGWTTLIDGTTGMDNFTVSGSSANWRAAEGAIQADKLNSGTGASVLITKKNYRDMDVYAEFWASDDTNSGIYVRAPDPANVNTASGAYEIQIWDKNPAQQYSTGSLVNVAAVQPIHKAGGRWNTLEIHVQGTEIAVKLNGVATASTKAAKTHEGRIGIQFNAGPIKVRKLQVRQL